MKKFGLCKFCNNEKELVKNGVTKQWMCKECSNRCSIFMLEGKDIIDVK